MKRILYIAAMVSLLITSCQKTDVLNIAEDTIDFVTEVGKLTKSDFSNEKYETLRHQGFRVWTFADFNRGIDKDGDIYRKMENLWVKFIPESEQSTKGTFQIQSNSKYFWPQDGDFLYFYTISAADTKWLGDLDHKTHFLPVVAADAENRGEGNEITGLQLPKFTVKPDANDDIMVADKIRQDKKDESGNSTKEVKPTFKHTMTKVQFLFAKSAPGTGDKAAEEAEKVILKEIKTDNLCKAGTLKVTYSTDAAAMMNKWTGSTDSDDQSPFTAIGNVVYTMSKKGLQLTSAMPDSPTEGSAYYTETKEDGKLVIRTIKEYVRKSDSATEYEWKDVETHTQNVTTATWEGKNNYSTFNGWDITSATHTAIVTWYMIPQLLTNANVNKNVTISYVADGKHLEQKFSLVGNNVTGWSEELCVKYNVTIAPHKIQFSPTVGEWSKYDSNASEDGQQDIEMQN